VPSIIASALGVLIVLVVHKHALVVETVQMQQRVPILKIVSRPQHVLDLQNVIQPGRVQIPKTVLKPQHVLTQPTATKLQPVPIQQDVPDIRFF
jgi:mannitol-specific phosphotransferase system IIBC component